MDPAAAECVAQSVTSPCLSVPFLPVSSSERITRTSCLPRIMRSSIRVVKRWAGSPGFSQLPPEGDPRSTEGPIGESP